MTAVYFQVGRPPVVDWWSREVRVYNYECFVNTYCLWCAWTRFEKFALGIPFLLTWFSPSIKYSSKIIFIHNNYIIFSNQSRNPTINKYIIYYIILHSCLARRCPRQIFVPLFNKYICTKCILYHIYYNSNYNINNLKCLQNRLSSFWVPIL